MKIGVIGSRQLPEKYQIKVREVVEYLLDKGHIVCHGGAMGADHFVLKALLENHSSNKGILFSAWKNIKDFPLAVQPEVEKYIAQKGQTQWGFGEKGNAYPAVCAALRARNQKLVSCAGGLVAFIYACPEHGRSGKSKGSLSTVSRAIKANIPVIVFPLSKVSLPAQKGMSWFPVYPKGIWEGALKAMYSSFNPLRAEKQEQKVLCRG